MNDFKYFNKTGFADVFWGRICIHLEDLEDKHNAFWFEKLETRKHLRAPLTMQNSLFLVADEFELAKDATADEL